MDSNRREEPIRARICRFVREKLQKEKRLLKNTKIESPPKKIKHEQEIADGQVP